MLSKLNVWVVIKDHRSTFVDETSDGPQKSRSDDLVFFGLPLVGGIAFASYASPLGESVVNIAMSVLALLTGLLLNLLVLTYGVLQGGKRSFENVDKVLIDRRVRLLRYLYANISFSILVSLADMLAYGAFLLGASWVFVVFAIRLVAGFLSSTLFLVLLLIIKRWHTLMSLEFER